jgi:thiamine phosphate synthase YjbQ (UPF0047 family)
MTVITRNFQVKSSRDKDIIDNTRQTLKAVKESEIGKGIDTVFVMGSNASIATTKYEADTSWIFQRCLPEEHQKILNMNMTMPGMMEMDTFMFLNP